MVHDRRHSGNTLGFRRAPAAGYFHNLALESDSTVGAWGDKDSGQSNVPAGLSGVVAVAAGYKHNLTLKRDGTVVAWGLNIYGQTNVPAGLFGLTAIAGGIDDSLALKSDGTVLAWSNNGTRGTARVDRLSPRR